MNTRSAQEFSTAALTKDSRSNGIIPHSGSGHKYKVKRGDLKKTAELSRKCGHAQAPSGVRRVVFGLYLLLMQSAYRQRRFDCFLVKLLRFG